MADGKSCANCVHNTITGCGKGEEAFDYCTAGNYELWAAMSPEKQAQIAKEVNDARDAEILPSPQDIEEQEDDDQDEDIEPASEEGQPAQPSSIDQLKAIARAMGASEEDVEKMAQTQQKLDQEETFQGYNGKTPDPQVIKSDTCENCKNLSPLIGCFLGKYTECTNAGRFLYESENPENDKPLEGEALEKYKASLQGEQHVDALMHDENQPVSDDEAHIDDLLEGL